jgi:glycosyltransferase involved in cell wall biosynthesis
MTTFPIAVIICTHNPREDFIARTLAGLAAQSLPRTEWELLVVDNASREPLAPRLDLGWHPRGRVIAEPEVGLTAARLRGITEARANLLIFVDDDNILAPDYVRRAAALGAAWPQLGVWGCGHYTPEWEVDPPPGFADYIAYLAVHRAPRDRWSNQPFDYPATPAGAGLCTRSAVARLYAENVRHDPRRKLLGRTGVNLAGCEDFDLALTAIDLGFGTGVFTELKLTHLMPRGRVEEAYLLRLVEGHACSTVLLHALRDSSFSPGQVSLLTRMREFRLRHSLGPVARRIHDARRRGERMAWGKIASAKMSAPDPIG